jgi:hypothetical protein
MEQRLSLIKEFSRLIPQIEAAYASGKITKRDLHLARSVFSDLVLDRYRRRHTELFHLVNRRSNGKD